MTKDDTSTRLNKYLAFHLGVSRRKADELIEKHAIHINGKPAQIGARVTTNDTVVLDGKPITPKQSYTYVTLHKPANYVCSRKQQGDTPTIYSLLPKEYRKLKTVGRLDADSSGLILLTDDGDFAYEMTHPKFAKHKRYEATLDRELEPLHQQMISDYGIQLDDGTSQLHLERQSNTDRLHWIITMSEGRNRQIRRTFTALGYIVTALHRTDFGNYQLDDLVPGQYIEVKK